MRKIVVECLIGLGVLTLSMPLAAQECLPALNENPCLQGEPMVAQVFPQYPNAIQLSPPGYMLRQRFDEYEHGHPVQMFQSSAGYRMDIAGITGEWGFSTEVFAAGCLELRVDGDFYVETEDVFIDDYFAFALGAAFWIQDAAPIIEMANRSLMEGGGSAGGRWRFYAPGEARWLTVQVFVVAREPSAGSGSVIEWRRIAVNAIDEAICQRQGVPVYPAPVSEATPEGTETAFQAG